MEVKVFQVIFEEGPYDEANKKYRYGKPKIETLKEVELTTGTPVDYYAIHTHDRGSYDRGPYYQVAFRVTDATPYDKQDVELKLDSAVYRNADHQIGNDLFYDQDNDLWYQLSRYEQNNKGEWRIIADNKKSALRVDSITAAGVFRIVAIRKGRIVKNDFCWVYVLPSSISKEEYTALLNDLIRIHEKLIVNSRSTVGVGTVQKKRSEAAHIKDEISDLKHLKSAIQAVIALPSESLEKQYYKESLEKVKRFDSRVIRDYIKNAGVGKIRSIKYNNDLDTYENRIIKHFLQRINQRNDDDKENLPAVLTSRQMEELVEQDLKHLFEVSKAEQHVATENTDNNLDNIHLDFHGPTWDGYELSIELNGNMVSTTSHHPFRSPGKLYIGVRFVASSRKEQLLFLEKICECYYRRIPMDIVCYSPDSRRPADPRQNIYIYTFSHLSEINGAHFTVENDDLPDETYRISLANMNNRFPFLHVLSNSFSFVSTVPTIIPRGEKKESRRLAAAKDDEIQSIRNDIKAMYRRKNESAKQRHAIFEARCSLTELLSNNWFGEISNIQSVSTIRPTQKFIHNRYYAEVFSLIVDYLENHPVLSGDFDINAFGVCSSQLVYEYWVFYKIIEYFEEMGFHKVESNLSLKEHFAGFVQQRQPSLKYSKYAAKLERGKGEDSISISIGYDMEFIESGKKRTPDYYICITQGEKNYWVFMDAKYKSFSETREVGKVYCYQEIFNVAICRYIYDMSSILPREDVILGSYIIMASMVEDNHDISQNDRLFGRSESLLQKDIKSTPDYDKRIVSGVDNAHGCPAHKYGAILLNPSNDGELRTLMQLVFEYLATEKNKDHYFMHFCWSCGAKLSPASRVQKPTFGGGSKYYNTCPKCSTFRVDSFCYACKNNSIIKHARNNYHVKSSTEDATDQDNQWAFYCPVCGSGLEDGGTRNNQRSSEYVTGFTAIETDELPF